MEKISFVINTSVNTLDHVKLLLQSLKDNLKSDEHEILIFVDSDNEGTVEYLKSIKDNFKDLTFITHKIVPCVGYSRNNNILVEKAKHKVISYLQSDMVVCKDYDEIVWSELEENCILSSTRIEPPLHGKSETTITKDFGLSPNQFDMKKFLSFSDQVKEDKTLPYFFAPITFHKKTWLKVGGYDTLFRRSREDSDLVIRLLKSGTKLKQTFKANVYHFTCVSSRGKNWFDSQNQVAQERSKIQQMADVVEFRRFLRKWGNFNHGEFDLVKYDIDFVFNREILTQQDVHFLMDIEPYVSRVWVDSDIDLSNILEYQKHEQSPANQLLNFTDSDWADNSRYYNTVDFTEIFRVGKPLDFNIRMDLKISDRLPSGNLQGIHQSLSEIESGQFEMGEFTFDVKHLKDITQNNIIVTNPEFDDSLIIIN